MAVTKLMVVLAVALFILGVTTSPVDALKVPITVDGVKNDHGFYTTEDKIEMIVTVTNNSTERVAFHVTGAQTDLGYEKVFSPGIEPNSFTLEPGKSFPFSRTMDNRWEGTFLVVFNAEGNGLENNVNYTGYANLRYQVHPPSDLFEQQNVEYNRWIAVASIIGAVGSPVVAIVAMKRQSSENKANVLRAETQHKETIEAMRKELDLEREEVNRNRQERKEEKYLRHSRRIAQALLQSYVVDRVSPKSVYERGDFTTTKLQLKRGSYFTQASAHMVIGYPSLSSLFTFVNT